MDFRKYTILLGKLSGSYGGQSVQGSVGDEVLLPPEDGDALEARGVVMLSPHDEEHPPIVVIETLPQEAPPVTPPTPPKLESDPPKLDINNCTFEELEALPAIGAKTARSIMAKRPYLNIEEVPGKAGLGGLVKANWYQVARLLEVVTPE